MYVMYVMHVMHVCHVCNVYCVAKACCIGSMCIARHKDCEANYFLAPPLAKAKVGQVQRQHTSASNNKMNVKIRKKNENF